MKKRTAPNRCEHLIMSTPPFFKFSFHKHIATKDANCRWMTFGRFCNSCWGCEWWRFWECSRGRDIHLLLQRRAWHTWLWDQTLLCRRVVGHVVSVAVKSLVIYSQSVGQLPLALLNMSHYQKLLLLFNCSNQLEIKQLYASKLDNRLDNKFASRAMGWILKWHAEA